MLNPALPERPHLLVDGLEREFGGLRAVRDMTLEVARGERRVILGPNGAGKSTLFNLIAGDLPPTRGSILLDGKDISRLSTHKRARMGVARSYQKSTLFGGLTATDNLRLAILGAQGPRFGVRRGKLRELESAARAAAVRAGLGSVADVETRYLSHGQQRQLELGMALVTSPRLLLLDEPAAGLSPAERSVLSSLLDQLPRSLTVILIEHDMAVALPFADRVTVMHNGSVVDEGTPQHVLNSDVIHDIYLGRSRV